MNIKETAPPYRQKKPAFTLAETLITLVIIGVVAAMTVPSLMLKQQEEQTSAKIKKTYTTLSNTMIYVKAAGGDTLFTAQDGSQAKINDWFNTYMKPHLSTTKICYDTAGCWNDGDTLNLNKSKAAYNVKGKGIGYGIITAILNDGTLINIDGYSGNDMMNYYGINTNGQDGFIIFFDINGKKQPNTIGKDIFIVGYKNSILVPAYYDKTQEQVNANCSNKQTGYSCIRQYLANK